MQNYNILVFLGSEYIINTTFLDFGNNKAFRSHFWIFIIIIIIFISNWMHFLLSEKIFFLFFFVITIFTFVRYYSSFFFSLICFLLNFSLDACFLNNYKICVNVSMFRKKIIVNLINFRRNHYLLFNSPTGRGKY